MTKTILIFVLCVPSWAQLTQATGDDFTVAVWTDTHTERSRTAWTNSVDWLLGANGRGQGGMSAILYWNIKAIAGVGDYVSTGSDDCDNAAVGSWTFATIGFQQIFAKGLPGVWPQGNHDICAQYAALFGSVAGIGYGSSATLQSRTFDVATSVGVVRLGLLGVGMADNMASGQPSRTFVDAAIAASQPNRQWILTRHVGTYDLLPGGNTFAYPADGNSGWCADNVGCAGWGNAGQTGVELRDNFYVKEPRVFFGVHGHNGGAVNVSVVADDGHTVHVVGNLGASGGTPGHIVLMKFRPSHHDIQMAFYTGSTATGVDGSWKYNNGTVMGPYTWAWTPQTTQPSTQVTATIRGGTVR